MNEVSKQQLSALLDDELGPDETRFALRGVHSDPDLAQLWSRYQLAGDALRGRGVPVAADLSVRIMRQVEAEQDAPAQPLARPAHGPARWLRYGMGGGIAAAVAVAALVWMQPHDTLSPRPLATKASTAVASSDRALADSATQPVTEAAAALPVSSPGLLQRSGRLLNVQPAAAVRDGRSALPFGQHLRAAQPAWMHSGAMRVGYQPQQFLPREHLPGAAAAPARMPPWQRERIVAQ